MRRFLATWVAGLSLALAGCATLPAPLATELQAGSPQEPDPYRERQPLPAAATPASVGALATAPDAAHLLSGLILVWSNPDAAGLFIGLFGEPFMPWTHIGVISVEPDGVFVYDTNANLSLTAEGPATGHQGRGVQRTPYQRYVDSGYIYGLYAPPPEVNITRMLDHVRTQYTRHVPFDARFDADDASALYCTELVAHAWVAAGAAPLRPVPARNNRSYNLVRRMLGIPDSGFWLPDQFADPERQLAVWSRRYTPGQIEALFAARRELARRLMPETRLGRLIRWQGMATSLSDAIRLREGPQRFVDAALALAEPQAPPEHIRERVVALAEHHFGPPPTR